MINVYIRSTDYEISTKKLESFEKYNKVIQWGRKYPTRFTEQILGIDLLDYQKFVFLNSWTTPYVVWCMGRNSGKAVGVNTTVPTPSGNKKMIDIKVGDIIFGGDGKPTKVLNVSEIFLNHKCYEVAFEDGERIIADEDHLWCILDDNNSWVTTITKDIVEHYNNQNKINFKRLSIPINKDISNFSEYLFNKNFKEIISVKEVATVPTKCLYVDNETHTYLCGDNYTVTHNTFLATPFIMSKSILIPNHETYILSNQGDQAKNTFLKLEKTAKKQIASLTGLTDVFLNEIVKNISEQDGFTHKQSGYSASLFNGSSIKTLNGTPENNVGYRSNLNKRKCSRIW